MRWLGRSTLPRWRQADPDPRAEGRSGYAARAARAYAAMQARYRMRSGLYRRAEAVFLPGKVAHVWPFARAMVATLDLAGVEPALIESVLDDFDADAAIADRLAALERYWDAQSAPPAYSSDPVPTRLGGDRYYDDNAWAGLALVQLERMRPGSGRLDRAVEVFQFAVSGWDTREDVPSPGGVFWVEQGQGQGSRNHDRNAVSNAPNAELGLHLAELMGGLGLEPGSVGPEDMYAWVAASLGADSVEDTTMGTGLFWDKIRGDNTIDRTLWSYNQGSMIGAGVLIARRGGEPADGHLARAEAIARKALAHYAKVGYDTQPPSFNAIFFRNLLLLHDATADEELREDILGAMRGYADWAWNERRDRRDGFWISHQDGLLDQSAMVQVLALLAWDPREYGRLA